MDKAVMELGSGKAFISKLMMSSYLRSQKLSATNEMKKTKLEKHIQVHNLLDKDKYC